MDLVSGLDALEADEIDLLITYNGDAIKRAAGNPAIRAILPKEGAPLWVDSFAVARDAPDPALAARFIRFMCSPEISAASANALCYASPYPEARDSVEPSLLSNPVLYPDPENAAKCHFVRFAPEVEKAVRQTVIGWISGDRAGGVAMKANAADPGSGGADRTSPAPAPED